METLKLLPFQEEIINITKNVRNVAYYYGMSCGKTFIGSEKAKINGVDILCICQKAKVEDWINHFKTYYPYKVFDLTCKKKLRDFFECDERKVGVMNYDIVYRNPILKMLNNYTLMLDESSLLQNIQTKRTSFIVNELEPDYVILLSGTPCGGHYEKLYPQMKLLGESCTENKWWADYVIFKKIKADKYKNTKGDWGTYPLILGYKNKDKLKDRMSDLNCHFKKTKEVVKDLPKKTNIIKTFENKEYNKVLKNGIAIYNDTEKELSKLNTLEKMLILRFFSTIIMCDEKREYINALMQSTDDRLLIFYNFQQECDLLEKMAKDNGKSVSFCNGKKKDWTAFNNDKNSVTLLHYKSGAMGLNLQIANKTIYASLPLSSELFEQSIARTARLGQKRPCFYYITLSGIEHKIMELLKRKQDYTDELFIKDKDFAFLF